MEYNTGREKLDIIEYGRNIRKMIEFACTIEDREKRNRAAKTIVAVMNQLNNPQRIDTQDFRQKMWDHLFILSDFKLDVDSPFPKPDPNHPEVQKFRCSYPNPSIAMRQYGKNMENIIAKVIDYEEGEEKETLVRYIANHLKKLYLSWNKDLVSDEVIGNHLQHMSGGKLAIPENTRLEAVREYFPPKKKKKPGKPGGMQSNYRDRNWKRKPQG